MNIGVSNAVGYSAPEVGDLVWTSPALVATGSGVPVISKIEDLAAALFSPGGNQSPLNPIGVLTFAPTKSPTQRVGIAVDRDTTKIKTYFSTGAISRGTTALVVYHPFVDRFYATHPTDTQWDQLPANTVGVEIGVFAEDVLGGEDDFTGLAAAYIDVSKVGLIFRRALATDPTDAGAFTGRFATESAPGTVAFLTAEPDAAPQGIGVFVQTPLADGIGGMLVPARGSYATGRGIAALSANLPTSTPLGLDASGLLVALAPTGSDYAQVGPWGGRSGSIARNVSAPLWEPQVILVSTP